jgi:hypothetical protein
MAEKKIVKTDKVLEEGIVEKTLETQISKRSFDDISFYILAAVTFLMPVFFLPLSLLGQAQTKLSVLLIGTIAALILCIIERIKKGSLQLNWGTGYLLMATVATVTAVSSFVGINATRSLIGSATEQDTFSTVLIGFVFITLLSYLSNTNKRVVFLLKLFLSSITLAIIVQLLRVVLGDVLSVGVLSSPVNTIVGSWSDITLLSLLLLGSLVIVLESVRLKKWVYLLLSIFTLIPFFFIILSGLTFDFYFFSISLLLVIVLLSVLIFAYIHSLNKTKANENIESVNANQGTASKLSASFIVLMFAVVFLIFGSQISGLLADKTKVKYIEGRPNWQATYMVASKVLAQKPFFGSGPNTFDREWNLLKTPDVNNYPFWNNEFNFAIGIVPTTAVTTGAVGFLLWCLFYAYVVKMSVKSLFRSNEEKGYVSRIVVSYGVLLTTFLMFFYAPGIVVQFAHLLFIGLLFAISTNANKSKEVMIDKSQWKNFVSTLVFIVAIIASVYWIYVISIKLTANNYYRRALLSSDPQTAITLIQKSISLDPTEPVYYQSVGQLYASKVDRMMSLSEKEIVDKKVELNTNITNAINYMVAGENIDKNDFKLKIATGKILEYFDSIGLPDASKGAIDRYMSASLNSPANPLPYLFATNITLNKGDKAAASDYLTKAISLKSDYSDVPQLGNEIRQIITKLNKEVVPVQTKVSTTTEDKAKAKTK